MAAVLRYCFRHEEAFQNYLKSSKYYKECKEKPDEEGYKRILELNRHYITHIHNANTDNNQKLFSLMLINDEMKEEVQYLREKAKNIRNRSFRIIVIAAVLVLGLLTLLYYREKRFKNFIRQMWGDIKDI